MIETLDDFIREYTKIKEMGWIKTHRSGPTGIGKTLEDLLGIPENNLDEPDFGEYELKSCRINSQSMLTMFTRAPQPARANTYLAVSMITTKRCFILLFLQTDLHRSPIQAIN